MTTISLHNDNTFKFAFLFTVILVVPCIIQYADSSKIPSYLHLCKRNDPHLEQCLLQMVESIRPKFETGIPELGIPPLDPLSLEQIVIFNGEKGEIKVIANNVKAVGVKNIKVRYVRINLDTLTLETQVYFPHLHFEGSYDVNAKIINFPVKGKGPMKGNATQVTANAVIRGKLITENGIKYMEFYDGRVDVDLKGYEIRVEKLFPDKKLNDAVNKVMNDPKVVPMTAVKPLMNKVAAKMLIDMLNKISKNIPYDDIFALI